MSIQQQLETLLPEMNPQQTQQLLQFARFLKWDEEHSDWKEIGKSHLSHAYSDHEPEYTTRIYNPEYQPAFSRLNLRIWEQVKMQQTAGFTVSDGSAVLILEPAEEGGYVVTSPLDPELIAEAETLEEAFENARDAADALAASRKKLKRC